MPVTVGDIQQFSQHLAPPELAAPWDNSGLLCGNPQQTVKRILVTLDLTNETIAEARAKGVEMIVSHHPLLLHPLQQILTTDYEGNLLIQLIEGHIALLALHTTLDNAQGGVNDVLAELLGLSEIGSVAPADHDNPSRLGRLPQEMTFRQLVTHIKTTLGLKYVHAVPQPGTFKRLAVCGGGGMDLWPAAQAAGADCLLSADGKHHIGLAAKDCGMALIDAGHFATEQVVIPRLAAALEEAFHSRDVEIIRSEKNTAPWQVL